MFFVFMKNTAAGPTGATGIQGAAGSTESLGPTRPAGATGAAETIGATGPGGESAATDPKPPL